MPATFWIHRVARTGTAERSHLRLSGEQSVELTLGYFCLEKKGSFKRPFSRSIETGRAITLPKRLSGSVLVGPT